MWNRQISSIMLDDRLQQNGVHLMYSNTAEIETPNTTSQIRDWQKKED